MSLDTFFANRKAKAPPLFERGFSRRSAIKRLKNPLLLFLGKFRIIIMNLKERTSRFHVDVNLDRCVFRHVLYSIVHDIDDDLAKALVISLDNGGWRKRS